MQVSVGHFFTVCLLSSVLYAGGDTPVYDDHSIRALRELNLAYWQLLGLDELQGEEGFDTVLELSPTAENDVVAIVSQICDAAEVFSPEPVNSDSHASGNTINTNTARDLARKFIVLAEDTENRYQLARSSYVPAFVQNHFPDTAIRLLEAQRLILSVYLSCRQYLDWARQRLNNVSQRCGSAIERYCPNLIYNPFSLIGLRPIIDPALIPVRWLQFPQIVQSLSRRWIRTNSACLIRRLRNFSGMKLPENTQWHGVLEGISFRDSELAYQDFYSCRLIKPDFRGADVYRCCFQNCSLDSVCSDEKTGILTSSIQGCADEVTANLFAGMALTSAGGLSFISATIQQDMIQHMLMLWYMQQIEQASLTFFLASGVTQVGVDGFVSEFSSMAGDYPDLINTVLQVLFAVLSSNDKDIDLHGVQQLMQVYAPDSLARMNRIIPEDGSALLDQYLMEVSWPQSELSEAQLIYQQNIATVLSQNQMAGIDIPMDHHCFYHVLAHQTTHQNSEYDANSSANRETVQQIRDKIVDFLTTYISYTNQVPQESALTSSEMMSQFNYMDLLLDSSSITLSMVQDLLDDAETHEAWPDVSALPIIAIIFNQPVLFIQPHHSNAEVGYIHPNGTIQENWEEAMGWPAAQTTYPIVMIHNSNFHWMTAIHLLIPAILLLQTPGSAN